MTHRSMPRQLALCTALALAASWASLAPAQAQAPTARARTQQVAPADPVRELILARRNLMAAIGRNMDGITGMVEPGGTLDGADAAEHADEIAVMLMAFPHLFPPGSQRWSKELEARDPASVSEASPAVWRENRDFRARAKAASQLATDASRSRDGEQFRVRAAALEASCAACHAIYRREEKPYTLPIAPLK